MSFLVQGMKKAEGGPVVEEIPSDDAGVLELVKYNSRRIYREYLGTADKRKVALDLTCFLTTCFAMKNYGELLSV